jgi:putative ABC transport system ATP-binding protein
MIKLENVIKTYSNGEVETHALSDVSLEINDGEFIVILGPSGSGKSTLLNLIGGLDKPTSGTIKVSKYILSDMDYKELTSFRRENLGFIFQQYNLLSTLTVYENVALGYHLGHKKITVDDMLDSVGIKSHSGKYPYQLSGGEQQRVSIARALIKEPMILFCDEPTGALDETNGKHILALLQKLNETYHTTIVLITHNPAISLLADRVVKMNSGKISDIIKNKEKADAESINWS